MDAGRRGELRSFVDCVYIIYTYTLCKHLPEGILVYFGVYLGTRVLTFDGRSGVEHAGFMICFA